jgi:hypothetical protein
MMAALLLSRAILLIVVGFLLGVLGFWFLQGPISDFFSSIFSGSNSGYSRYGGYGGNDGGYGGYASYGRYGGYRGYGGNNGGYGGYGGGAAYGNWGQPAYAFSAPYPRRIRRPLPPPCFSPCDY